MKYILLAIVISACVFYAQGARAEMPPLQPGLNIVGGTGEQPAAYAAHNDCVYAIYS